ncbi:MAG: acyl carrier protein [Magnetococcales bacterium]|nr:acyl carrier protein [Magnetococcales bacterium]
MNILPRLETIMRSVFQDPGLKLTPTLSMKEVPAWDSIGHIQLITAVEEAFGFLCPLDELVQIDTVEGLVTLIEKQIDRLDPV